MVTTQPEEAASLCLKVERSSDGYVLRPAGSGVVDASAARSQLLARMALDGPADEEVTLSFVGDVGLEAVFDGTSAEVVSIGWEGLLVPFARRRRIDMPRGFTITTGAGHVEDQKLHALHRLSRPSLASPLLDIEESMLVHREGDLVGWVPVMRLTPTVSSIRFVCIHANVHREEERRRTYLRLATYAQAVEAQCSQGRSVLTWLPDDGDPVNEYKVSVAGATLSTHWMSTRVRRDLAAARP